VNVTKQTVHKNRSLLALTSQFDITVTDAASAAAAAAADDDDDGASASGDDILLSSVRVLLSSVCFLLISFSHSVQQQQPVLYRYGGWKDRRKESKGSVKDRSSLSG